MMNYKTSAELKQEVKDLFKGRWIDAILLNLVQYGVIILMTFVLWVVIIIFSVLFMSVDNGYGDPNYFANFMIIIIGVAVYIAFILLIALVSLGVDFAYLDWLRDPDMKSNPADRFTQVFKNKMPKKLIVTNLLIAIFTFLWTLLFYIPGMIKSFSYSQANYILKDMNDSNNSEYRSATYYITESRNLMNGHKGRLLYISLSFIGWTFVGALTFGIAYIWIMPYMMATFAAFYKDLAQNKYLNNVEDTNL